MSTTIQAPHGDMGWSDHRLARALEQPDQSFWQDVFAQAQALQYGSADSVALTASSDEGMAKMPHPATARIQAGRAPVGAPPGGQGEAGIHSLPTAWSVANSHAGNQRTQGPMPPNRITDVLAEAPGRAKQERPAETATPSDQAPGTSAPGARMDAGAGAAHMSVSWQLTKDRQRLLYLRAPAMNAETALLLAGQLAAPDPSRGPIEAIFLNGRRIWPPGRTADSQTFLTI